jgi:hypothetical protein
MNAHSNPGSFIKADLYPEAGNDPSPIPYIKVTEGIRQICFKKQSYYAKPAENIRNFNARATPTSKKTPEGVFCSSEEQT